MKKIIFLDIDGVLVTSEIKHPSNKRPEFNKECLKNFEKLCEQIGDYGVVIMSKRRRGKDISILKEMFKERGFKYYNNIIGVTLVLEHGYDKVDRGIEVDRYIKDNNLDINKLKYVLIDDDNDFLPHQLKNHIETTFEKGFTTDALEKALKILK